MNNPTPPTPGFFSAIDRISQYPGQPMNEKYHKKMLQQLQAYHNTARENKEFSLVQSLEVLSKFVMTDFWLTTVITEEIRFLRIHNLKNPYYPE